MDIYREGTLSSLKTVTWAHAASGSVFLGMFKGIFQCIFRGFHSTLQNELWVLISELVLMVPLPLLLKPFRHSPALKVSLGAVQQYPRHTSVRIICVVSTAHDVPQVGLLCGCATPESVILIF